MCRMNVNYLPDCHIHESMRTRKIFSPSSKTTVWWFLSSLSFSYVKVSNYVDYSYDSRKQHGYRRKKCKIYIYVSWMNNENRIQFHWLCVQRWHELFNCQYFLFMTLTVGWKLIFDILTDLISSVSICSIDK